MSDKGNTFSQPETHSDSGIPFADAERGSIPNDLNTMSSERVDNRAPGNIANLLHDNGRHVTFNSGAPQMITCESRDDQNEAPHRAGSGADDRDEEADEPKGPRAKSMSVPGTDTETYNAVMAIIGKVSH